MSYNFFLSGVYMITFAASGLFFFKFYRASGDRFFRHFGLACWLLAAERVFLLFMNHPFQGDAQSDDPRLWVYLFRLVAFLMIVFAIVSKNRQEAGTKRDL